VLQKRRERKGVHLPVDVSPIVEPNTSNHLRFARNLEAMQCVGHHIGSGGRCSHLMRAITKDETVKLPIPPYWKLSMMQWVASAPSTSRRHQLAPPQQHSTHTHTLLTNEVQHPVDEVVLRVQTLLATRSWCKEGFV